MKLRDRDLLMSLPSEVSDIYSSSIYEGEPCLYFSEDTQLFTPGSSESEQTLHSASDSVFVRPQPPPSIPDTLQRVGPTKTKGYVLIPRCQETRLSSGG